MFTKNNSKFIAAFSIVAFFSTLFYNCTEEQGTENQAATVADSLITTKPQNIDKTKYPNDDSELAWLMRQMYEDGEKIKVAVQNKQLPEDFREKFKNIHTAIPTDSTVKGAVFDTSAKAFLATMDKFYSEKENQVENFNLVVNACVACHQNYCPGPIKKIKKLAIK
jgi:hypothetical protein